MKPEDIINDDAQLEAQEFVNENESMFAHAKWLCTLKIAELLRKFAKSEEEKIKDALKNFKITPL